MKSDQQVTLHPTSADTTVETEPKVKSTVGRPKSQEKRQQILCSAGELFLQLGYANTSMDAVAKASGVSKQTVYSHFSNKDELFAAVIRDKCNEYQLNAVPNQADNLQQQLTHIGAQFVALMHDESVIAMYSAIIGESKFHSELAHVFYREGPEPAQKRVQGCLTNAIPTLDEKNAYELTTDFFNLLKGDYHMRSMLSMPFAMSAPEQRRFVDKSVAKFIRILGV